MRAVGSVAMKPFGPPPHVVGASFAMGLLGPPTASRRGPLLQWEGQGPRFIEARASFALCLPAPRCIRAGASVAVEPLGPPPHQGTGLFRSRIVGHPTALGQGPPSLWIHSGPRCITAGTSFRVGLLGLPPHQGRTSFALGLPGPPPPAPGLRCFGAIGPPASSGQGPLS